MWLYLDMGVFKVVIKLKGDHLTQSGWCPIRRADQDTDTHRGPTIWGHKEKTAIYAAMREASGDTSPAHTLVSDFQPRTVRH